MDAMATDPLLDRLTSQKWPKPIGDHPAPRPGQLWRATWGGVVAFVVVLSSPKGRWIEVAAASPELSGDDSSIEIETTNSMRVVVWMSISSDIMMFTLDHRIGDLAEDAIQMLRGPDRTRHQWGPILSVLDDRAVERARLQDELAVMHDAEWLSSSGPQPTDVRALAAGHGLRASEIARALSITAGSARRLLQGERELAPGEADLLAPLLGESPSSAAAFDPQLVEALDLPQFRPAIDARAANRFNRNEIAARRDLATAVLSMAARHRSPGDRNWELLVDEALRAD
jgi:plasmid maintenance system antidote protein VapI